VPIRQFTQLDSRSACSLLADCPNDAAGIAGGEDSGRDLPCDHAPGSNDRFRADLHSRANDRAAANPHIGADFDWFAEFLLATQVGIHRVRGRINLDCRAEQARVANRHLAYIQYDAVEIEKHATAEQDIFSLVAEERRLHPDRIAPPAEELLQNRAAELLVPLASGVQVLA